MTCLKDTFNFIMDNRSWDEYIIIHAIVERPTDKLRHPHAVVLNTKTHNIHEVSNIFKDDNVVMPFMLWVSLGKVSNVKQYTFQEYNELLVEHKKWEFFHLP